MHLPKPPTVCQACSRPPSTVRTLPEIHTPWAIHTRKRILMFPLTRTISGAPTSCQGTNDLEAWPPPHALQRRHKALSANEALLFRDPHPAPLHKQTQTRMSPTTRAGQHPRAFNHPVAKEGAARIQIEARHPCLEARGVQGRVLSARRLHRT